MNEIKNPVLDPAWSIAAEEYLLEHEKSGELFMLWRGRPSVIIGKFQNYFEEVSPLLVEKSGVEVVRRNSGGGTVYHDLGNVNFTVFADRADGELSYERFLAPIVDFLRALGVNAEIDSTSALVVGGKKISGNAQTAVGGRVMHHGTLLFDVELGALSALTGNAREKITSRSIKSNPSPVTNIRPHLAHDMTVDEFIDALSAHLGGKDHTTRRFSPDEIAEIDRIASEKYRTWQWTYGKCPAFTLESEHVTLRSKGGVILEASSRDDAYNVALQHVVGCRIDERELRSALEKSGTDDGITTKIINEILG